jgi:hypothetical protein
LVVTRPWPEATEIWQDLSMKFLLFSELLLSTPRSMKIAKAL